MNKELAQSIGNAARQARKALRLTQEDAAERINVSAEFYARIERGKSLPSIVTFARMVSALDVSADLMLGHQGTYRAMPAPASWTPTPPNDKPEVRRLLRRLRKAPSSTLRLVGLLLNELERAPASNDQALPDSQSKNTANGNDERLTATN